MDILNEHMHCLFRLRTFNIYYNIILVLWFSFFLKFSLFVINYNIMKTENQNQQLPFAPDTC